eukprot:621205-Pyramimonas_sp.AAC.1
MTWLVPNKDQIAQDTSGLAGSERSQKDRKLYNGKRGGNGGGGKDKGKEGEGEGAAAMEAGEDPATGGGPASAAAQGARAVCSKRGGEACRARVDPKLKKLLAVLIKQFLANTQQLAWMVAAVSSTHLLPIQNNAVKALKTSHKLNAEKCNDQDK